MPTKRDPRQRELIEHNKRDKLTYDGNQMGPLGSHWKVTVVEQSRTPPPGQRLNEFTARIILCFATQAKVLSRNLRIGEERPKRHSALLQMLHHSGSANSPANKLSLLNTEKEHPGSQLIENRIWFRGHQFRRSDPNSTTFLL
jgi:hypothetical protein